MQSYLQSIAKKIQDAGILRVGFLENATYPDGTLVAEIAAKNEYGAKGVPMRPYFRTMIKEKKAGWAVSIGQVLANNNYDIDKTWQLMGEGIRGQLQQSIRDWTTPPNSKETADRKGFNKPLIDSGHMLNSVDYDYGKKE
jgi:hypothetical protein